MIFRTWDLIFGDLNSSNWGVPWSRTWKCLGHDFQDVESHLWDLDFTSGVSKIQTWKLLGHDFQDVGPQIWDLDFHTGGGFDDLGHGIVLGHGFQDGGSHLWDLDFTFGVSKDPNLETLRTWYPGRGTSVLGSKFSHWGWWFPWPRTWKFLGHGFSRREIKSSVFGDLEFAPTDDQWRRIEKRMPRGRWRSSSTAHIETHTETHTQSTTTHYARVQRQAKRESKRECARILVKEVDSLWKIVVSKKWIVLLAAEFKVPISEAL
jgi:hypothetical protein